MQRCEQEEKGSRIVLVISWENKGSSEDAHILIQDLSKLPHSKGEIYLQME